MDYTLVRYQPEKGHNTCALDDILLPLSFALPRLGYTVENRKVQKAEELAKLPATGQNILFGVSSLLAAQPGVSLSSLIPSGCILFNDLRLTGSPELSDVEKRYLEELASFTVWDYSPRRVEMLLQYGHKNVHLAPLGYVPEMRRIAKDFPKDVDVLFYGEVNERRQSLINELGRRGVGVGVLQDGYGDERDHAIARSRLILNIHHSLPAVLEMPRLGYLWANGKAVVSELSPDTEIPAGLEQACHYASYETLVDAVVGLLGNEQALQEQGRQGFEAFSKLRQEDLLTPLTGSKNNSRKVPVPQILNAGSGKRFNPVYLNIDINPAMNPDLVLDLSRPIEWGSTCSTVRFGDFKLRQGRFERIIAMDVLEHVVDLIPMMTNFINLLRDGGELFATVPYDLSTGAWQDPTHVRAFNEKSWMYYESWAWYVGWRDFRFDIANINYAISPMGRQMVNNGETLDTLLHTPRAIGSLEVTLRKRQTTPKEREEYDRLTRSYYDGAVGDWSI